MITQTIEQYTITVFINKRANDRLYCDYALFKPGKILKTGTFTTPTYFNPNVAIIALDAACLMPGDTDQEYFDSFTPQEMEWATSFECEQLSCQQIILENEYCCECGYWLHECENWSYRVNDNGTYTCDDCI